MYVNILSCLKNTQHTTLITSLQQSCLGIDGAGLSPQYRVFGLNLPPTPAGAGTSSEERSVEVVPIRRCCAGRVPIARSFGLAGRVDGVRFGVGTASG